MEIRSLEALSINDTSHVAEARRLAAGLARGLSFDEAEAGKLGILVTEAATNLLKHSNGGELIFNALESRQRRGMAVLALDKGPGIENLGESLRDGYSTSGSPGTGLGAMIRLSTHFDIYSRPGAGTAVLMRLWARNAAEGEPRPWPVRIGAVSVPRPGEAVCGDAWSVRREGPFTSLLLADGLGHGIDAAEAASEAVRVFQARAGAPADVLADIHAALRPTRGAVVALAQIDLARRVVRFAGVGNISAVIVGPDSERNLLSLNGTMGHEVPRIRESAYPWPEQALLILHSDGVSRKWDLGHYPGLLSRAPELVAGVLYRDFKRDRDDVTIVVASGTGECR